MHILFETEELYRIDDQFSQIGKFFGKNNRKILLSVSSATWHDPDSKALVHNILKALDWDPEEDVLLFIRHRERPFSLVQLMREHACRAAVVFGMEPVPAGIRAACRKYHPLRIGGFVFLFADNVGALLSPGARPLKKALWDGLQKLRQDLEY